MTRGVSPRVAQTEAQLVQRPGSERGEVVMESYRGLYTWGDMASLGSGMSIVSTALCPSLKLPFLPCTKKKAWGVVIHRAELHASDPSQAHSPSGPGPPLPRSRVRCSTDRATQAPLSSSTLKDPCDYITHLFTPRNPEEPPYFRVS